MIGMMVAVNESEGSVSSWRSTSALAWVLQLSWSGNKVRSSCQHSSYGIVGR